jgi:hypothetical protein
MPAATHLALGGWSNFYVVMGSASAALTGLMFVVVTLIARRATGSSHDTYHAFGTPIVVHFTFVLMMAGVLTMPGHTNWSAAACAGLLSLAGTGYLAVSAVLMRRQNEYQPDAEDWFWYLVAPAIVYVACAIASLSIPWHPAGALYGIAAAVMVQLFIGIHNAWDTAAYIAVESARESEAAPSSRPSSEDAAAADR